MKPASVLPSTAWQLSCEHGARLPDVDRALSAKATRRRSMRSKVSTFQSVARGAKGAGSVCRAVRATVALGGVGVGVGGFRLGRGMRCSSPTANVAIARAADSETVVRCWTLANDRTNRTGFAAAPRSRQRRITSHRTMALYSVSSVSRFEAEVELAE